MGKGNSSHEPLRQGFPTGHSPFHINHSEIAEAHLITTEVPALQTMGGMIERPVKPRMRGFCSWRLVVDARELGSAKSVMVKERRRGSSRPIALLANPKEAGNVIDVMAPVTPTSQTPPARRDASDAFGQYRDSEQRSAERRELLPGLVHANRTPDSAGVRPSRCVAPHSRRSEAVRLREPRSIHVSETGCDVERQSALRRSESISGQADRTRALPAVGQREHVVQPLRAPTPLFRDQRQMARVTVVLRRTFFDEPDDDAADELPIAIQKDLDILEFVAGLLHRVNNAPSPGSED